MSVLLLMVALAAEPPSTGPFGADRPARTPLAPTWDTWGWMRLRGEVMTNPPIDDTGTTLDRPAWLGARFVYGVGWTPSPNFQAEVEVEELNGNLLGPFSDLGTGADPDPFRISRTDRKDLPLTWPRKVNLTFRDPDVGLLRVGAQTFSWGTGMLANDGAQDPDFGDPDQGNTNLRLLAATAPWRNKEGGSEALRGLSLFVAGDLVLRDDNAYALQGDLAAQAVLGLRVQSPRFDLGVLGVARWQKDRPEVGREDRAVTTAFPVDLYARVTLTPLTWDQRLVLEAEGALVTGRTTRPYFEETREEGARLLSGGMVARLRYDNTPRRLTVKAEVGFASGDNDPRDDVSRSFSLHSDHEVGLLLFEQVLPALTARAADRATDPALVAEPAPGARYLINQGQVTNAVYLQPTVRWRPLEDLDLRMGCLTAWSAGDMYDLFATGAAGGWPTGYGGQDPQRHFLGHEMMLGARWRWGWPPNLALELGAEGAVLAPGAALAALDMPVQGTGRLRFDFYW